MTVLEPTRAEASDRGSHPTNIHFERALTFLDRHNAAESRDDQRHDFKDDHINVEPPASTTMGLSFFTDVSSGMINNHPNPLQVLSLIHI